MRKTLESEEEMHPGDIVGLNQKNGLVRHYVKGDPLIGGDDQSFF